MLLLLLSLLSFSLSLDDDVSDEEEIGDAKVRIKSSRNGRNDAEEDEMSMSIQ